MNSILVFDCETDGLLNQLTKLHCLVIRDIANGIDYSFHGDEIEKGVRLLQDAPCICGHNVIGFDIPAIQKVYPWFSPKGTVRDTLILTRLLWPSEQIKDIDHRKAANGFPKNLVGVYSLAAWGYRIGDYKGDYKGPWDTWSKEMQDYCEQDVRVTVALLERCLKRLEEWGLPFGFCPPIGKDAVDLEHRVATIISRQERRGISFNLAAAQKLYARLMVRSCELEAELGRTFHPEIISVPFTPKRDNKPKGWKAGQTIYRQKEIPFNPSSRPQVAKRLKEFGWEPTEFTDGGQPKVDDDILASLEYPEAKLLAEYYMVQKRLGQLGDGKQALIKAERNGRIYGRVVTNGAVTGRMTHSSPNLAQVPKHGVPYGDEFRALFHASPGLTLVGCDADALELRCLAAFMARYDGGAYIRAVLEGKKEDGTDIRTLNAQALGCDRETAKTWF